MRFLALSCPRWGGAGLTPSPLPPPTRWRAWEGERKNGTVYPGQRPATLRSPGLRSATPLGSGGSEAGRPYLGLLSDRLRDFGQARYAREGAGDSRLGRFSPGRRPLRGLALGYCRRAARGAQSAALRAGGEKKKWHGLPKAATAGRSCLGLLPPRPEGRAKCRAARGGGGKKKWRGLAKAAAAARSCLGLLPPRDGARKVPRCAREGSLVRST